MLHAVAAPLAALPTSVPRPRLTDRLVDAQTPLVVIAAAAGHGKTTLLDEWERRDARPFARLALDERDDDPEHLEARLGRAVDSVRGASAHVVALDDVHVLRSSGALAAVRALAVDVGPGCALALASRTAPALPLARMRANRSLTEVTARDLVMTTLEAGALLARAGLDAAPAVVEELVRKTEGWPAGLTLAAVALRDHADALAAAARFGGDDAIVAEYVRDEVLAALPADAVDFLRHSSVLDRLTGPLCDAVLERRGSACVLSELGEADLVLLALDRKHERFRCHGLVRDTLRAELRRTEPDEARALHTRAADWFERNGEADRALHHAVEAGDDARASALVRVLAPAQVTPIRDRALRRRLRRFGDEQIGGRPALALAAANSAWLRGDLPGVERRAAALSVCFGASSSSEQEAAVALLRAAVAADGLERMRADAARAYELEPADSPWRALCCLLEGVGLHLTGRRDAAEARLDEGVRRAAVAAPNVQTLCLAQLALLAAEREDWEAGAAYSSRALSQIGHYGLEAHPTSALAFAAAAAIGARRGRVADAQEASRTARGMLSRLADFAPWYEVEARVWLAHAAQRLSDLGGARGLLCDASRHARRIPDAGVLREWIDELSAHGRAASASAPAASAALTPAELRILTFLPTHLSFREVAAGLHVSANTVKTQAHAIYRKLDAGSRSEAVARATALGLLDT
jgi:LuxR family transcriptional regulator, maltose regulon positive regulatory protein